MLPKQVLQKTIYQMKSIIDCEISLWTIQQKCLCTTNAIDSGTEQDIKAWIKEPPKKTNLIDYNYCGFFAYNDEKVEYILVIKNEKQADINTIGNLCASQLEGLINAYKERLDKNHFIQSLLLDNLLLVDIYNKARSLMIPVEERRIVYIIEPKKEEDSIVMETLKGLYATSLRDFITAVDEGHIIYVKTLENTDGDKEILHIAKTMQDTLSAEAMVSVRVAYGTVIKELKDVAQSYKEAHMALEVGRIFYGEQGVLAYDRLGIGRLIYQLPVSLCEIFLKEVLEGKAMNQFDEETLGTVYKFFENNLNVSETARQLYIHRNTLVYRLEKIQKSTGLDVRIFDDAMIFKIALMVANHMNFLHSEK